MSDKHTANDADNAATSDTVGEPTLTVEDENREIQELSIGEVVAYNVGALTVIFAVVTVMDAPDAALLYLLAGTFGFPPVREMIADEFNVRLSRWRAVLLYLALITLGGVISAGG